MSESDTNVRRVSTSAMMTTVRMVGCSNAAREESYALMIHSLRRRGKSKLEWGESEIPAVRGVVDEDVRFGMGRTGSGDVTVHGNKNLNEVSNE